MLLGGGAVIIIVLYALGTAYEPLIIAGAVVGAFLTANNSQTIDSESFFSTVF